MKITGTVKRWPRILLGLALCCLLPLPGLAQNAKLRLDNLEKLSNKAVEVNDVTLDGQMLQLASKFMDIEKDPEAAQIKDILKDLKGIYVKNFEFDKPGQYSREDVEEIRSQLASPAWSRIIQSHSIRDNETDEVYVLKEGNKIGGVAILIAEPKELTVVNIVGFLDPDKLSLLEGKFGIPEVKEQPKKPSPEAPNEKE